MNYLYSRQYDPLGFSPRFFGQAMVQPGMSGFPIVGFPDIFAEERQVFEDARKLQAFYPRIAQEIQQHVEEECDKLEYEGSWMFDEYPDRMMLVRLTGKIADKMKDFSEEEALMNPAPVLETSSRTASGGEMLLEGQSPERGRRRRDENWLENLIQVLLVDEMHRRRCRHRRCRERRFW